MAEEPSSWPTLDRIQRRLLGVLVEKAKTTPEAYPLSLNALVTGSNQKSNRDPVLNVNDEDVEESVSALQKLGLVTRITGSRVDRWRHNLYEVWKLDKVELSLIAELLLRGPQTEGELRSRAARMDPIADLDELREKLKPLRERGLISWFGDEGKRGSQIAHTFFSTAELESLRSPARSESPTHVPVCAPAAPSVAAPSDEIVTLRDEVATLRSQVNRLEDAVAGLTQEVKTLKQSLGG